MNFTYIFALLLSLVVQSVSANQVNEDTSSKQMPVSEEKSEWSNLVPTLIESENPPFIRDEAFGSSCGSEGTNLPNGVANIISNNSFVGSHYFFFSLSQFLKDPLKQKHEYRFFKNNQFKGTPAFVLDEVGLKQNGKLVCKWRMKYNENVLYGNNLGDCFEKDTYTSTKSFLAFESIGEPQGSIELCAVMKVDSYKVDKGIYDYAIDINGNKYFLDTSDMPGLINGDKFYSKEKRSLVEYQKSSEKAYEIAQFFVNFKVSPLYDEILKCIVLKDSTCLDKYWSSDFFADVAIAGYQHICNNGRSTSDEGPKCGDGYEEYQGQIREVIYKYLTEIFDDISKLKTENFSRSGDNIFYKVPSPHTRMGDAKIWLEIGPSKFKLINFNDGLSC